MKITLKMGEIIRVYNNDSIKIIINQPILCCFMTKNSTKLMSSHANI